MMSGPAERAIRDHIVAGTRLPTPTGTATFVVHQLRQTDVVLLLGQTEAWTPLRWEWLEGALKFLQGRGWVHVGANRVLPGDPATLDGYLKGCLKRQTANYVAVLLERADLVELDRERPARVRLRASQ